MKPLRMKSLRIVAAIVVAFSLASGWGMAGARESTVDDWIKKLQSSKSTERREAALELGRLGDSRAVLPLIRLLRDAEPMVRLDASGALIELGTPVVEPLIDEIKNETDSIFLWNAIRVLETIGDTRAVEPIRFVKENHGDPTIQQIAEYALNKLAGAGKK